MQHLWIHHRQKACTFKNYQETIERVKLTPRAWNSSINIHQTLKYISWALGISINLIKFKSKHANLKKSYLCTHHDSICYIPYYQFNNPFIKLSQINQSSPFCQINILEFKSKYYSIPSNSCHPILINKMPNFNFDTVNKNEINQILQGKHVEKAFMVGLYSTPSFVRTQNTNIIAQNLIGMLKNNSTQVIHLFITPHLDSSDFDVYQLETLNKLNYKNFNMKTNFSCTRPTEGNYNFKSTTEFTNKNILNQNHCVCEHPDTARYFAPTQHSFQSLGKNHKKNINNKFTHLLTTIDLITFSFSANGANQKNFLYENLGKFPYFFFHKKINKILIFTTTFLEAFGFLTEQLSLKLKICSEISFLR
jgi:hypothetical protein